MPVDQVARSRLVMYAVLLLLVGLPYLIAWKLAGAEIVFGGFLFNPIDGYSYLAKMHQGWQGSWRFTLPFSAQPGNGAYIFLFYLLLGHIARITLFPFQVVFHLARLAGALFMVWSLNRFIERSLPGRMGVRSALFLTAFGSGMGWLALAAGLFTADLWVSEAYPFLSAYNNPHFPISLGLLVWLIMPINQDSRIAQQTGSGRNWFSGWKFGLGAMALAELSPFGSILALLISGILAVWEQWELKTFKPASSWLLRAAWIGVGAGPVLLYTWWAVQIDPVLAGWNVQNLTPSPPWWDLAISLSPVLPIAVAGCVLALKQKQHEIRPALVWGLLALLIVSLPLGLQRRFLIGIYVPIGILAVLALIHLCNRSRAGNLLLVCVLGLSLPSNLVVLLAGWQGISSQDERIYLSADEVEALKWISDNTNEDALLLAGPESGLLIPAWTGRRVLYGHPFETVDAVHERALVEDFFAGRLTTHAAWLMIEQRQVDFIYRGPRERGGHPPPSLLPAGGLLLVYQNQSTAIYQVVEAERNLSQESEGGQ
jgi:hypothetical protein